MEFLDESDVDFYVLPMAKCVPRVMQPLAIQVASQSVLSCSYFMNALCASLLTGNSIVAGGASHNDTGTWGILLASIQWYRVILLFDITSTF